jgi:predicted Zn-dependent protease
LPLVQPGLLLTLKKITMKKMVFLLVLAGFFAAGSTAVLSAGILAVLDAGTLGPGTLAAPKGPEINGPSDNDHKHLIAGALEADHHVEVIRIIDSLRTSGIVSDELSWQYARSLFQAAHYDQARDSLAAWEDDPEKSTQVKNMLVTIAIQQRNEIEAIRHLIQLRDRYPENPVYPHRLARVFTARNELPAAEAQLALAHSLDSLNQVVILEWADVLSKLDVPHRALFVLNRGLRHSPDNIGFRRQKAILDYRMRRHEAVIRNVEHLMQLGDTVPQVVKTMAFSQFQTGNPDEAERWIDYLLDRELWGEDLMYYKALILSGRGEKSEAAAYFREAVNGCLSPNFNPFALQAGMNLFELGRYPETIRWLRMLEMFSTNLLITFYLAETYYQYYQDKSTALEYYQAFLDKSVAEAEAEHREVAGYRIRQIREDMHMGL